MKNNGWANTLFAMVFIAMPFLVLAFFVFHVAPFKNNMLNISLMTIGFTIYAIGFSFIVVWLDVLHIDSLKFNIPITLVFMVLLFTFDTELYYIIPFSIVAILTTIPTNIFVTKYKESRIRK